MPTIAANKPLTGKQARFVEEYIIDSNATRAAIMAGYAANSATVTGCRLLMKANIKQALARKQDVLSQKVEYSQKIALSKLLHAYDLAEELKQPSAMVSAGVAANRMFGYDKDNNERDQVSIVINPPTQHRTRPIEATVAPCDVIDADLVP